VNLVCCRAPPSISFRPFPEPSSFMNQPSRQRITKAEGKPSHLVEKTKSYRWHKLTVVREPEARVQSDLCREASSDDKNREREDHPPLDNKNLYRIGITARSSPRSPKDPFGERARHRRRHANLSSSESFHSLLSIVTTPLARELTPKL
jgi:hypothetical protein